MDEIQARSKTLADKKIEQLADEANSNLIDASYRESLIPTIQARIDLIDTELGKARTDLTVIESAMEGLVGKALYEKREETKPIKKRIRNLDQARTKDLEKLENFRQHIHSLRFDAQANLLKMEFIKTIGATTLVDSLNEHIEKQKNPVVEVEDVTPEAPAPVVENTTDEGEAASEVEPTPEQA